MRLGTAIELGGRGGLPRPGRERGHRTHFHEPPPDAGDGGPAHLEGVGDALIRPVGTTRRFISLEQDAGMGLAAGCRLARAHDLLQGRPFFIRQPHPILHPGRIERGVRWDNRC